MVKLFVEELSGGSLAAVKRRGEHVAVILSPPLVYSLPLEGRVDLINRLLMCVAGSGTAAAVLELLAS